MFSDRVPANLSTNRLSLALARLRSEKRPFLDLTGSNPTTAGFEYPSDLLKPLASRRGLEYDPQPFGMLAARRAVAADYARRGVTIASDRIVLTASSSESYSLLFKVLCNAGDEVLVPRPSYPLFEHLATLDGVVARPYELDVHAGWAIDAPGISRLVTPRTRALLMVSPNNPTGSYVSGTELGEAAAVAGASSLAIVVDEVFADYELTPGAAAFAGRVAERDDVLTFSLGGLSKAIGLPQVKLGWMAAAGPGPLLSEALEKLEMACDTYLSVSTPVQAALPELLEHGGTVRAQIQDRTRANLSLLRDLVAGTPECRVLPAGGGWSAVLQVPTLQSEEDLVVGLLETEAVLVHPGYFFDFPRESFLVVSLLTPRAVFHDGMTRILRHFNCRVG